MCYSFKLLIHLNINIIEVTVSEHFEITYLVAKRWEVILFLLFIYFETF